MQWTASGRFGALRKKGIIKSTRSKRSGIGVTAATTQGSRDDESAMFGSEMAKL
jgi:hypothetical protein